MKIPGSPFSEPSLSLLEALPPPWLPPCCSKGPAGPPSTGSRCADTLGPAAALVSPVHASLPCVPPSSCPAGSGWAITRGLPAGELPAACTKLGPATTAEVSVTLPRWLLLASRLSPWLPPPSRPASLWAALRGRVTDLRAYGEGVMGGVGGQGVEYVAGGTPPTLRYSTFDPARGALRTLPKATARRRVLQLRSAASTLPDGGKL